MKWDAKNYSEKHNFVFHYGRDVVSLLQPQAGENILDIGCGTGELTAQIAQSSAKVLGIDVSNDMLEQAKKEFPTIQFDFQDIRSLPFINEFDAVFSNAVLHWIPKEDQELACQNIAKSLKSGGRFVAEFGGFGNHAAIIAAETAIWKKHGYSLQIPLYFPTISEYATLLESNGFLVHTAILFPRLTELADGEHGMVNLINMFHARFMDNLDFEEQQRMIQKVSDQLQKEFYRNGHWYADYVRIRIAAEKL